MQQDSPPHDGLASPVFSSDSSSSSTSSYASSSSKDSSPDEHDNLEPENPQEINADNPNYILVEQGFALNEIPAEDEFAVNLLLDVSRVVSLNPEQPIEVGQGMDPSSVDEPVQGMDPSSVDEPVQGMDPSSVDEPVQGMDPSSVDGPVQGMDPSSVDGPVQGMDPSSVDGPVQGMDPSSVDGPVQEMDQSEPPQENVSTARRRLFPSKESDTLSRLQSLALMQTDHLLSKLPDLDDPPGRLPVSIILPDVQVDVWASNLLTRRAMLKFFGSKEIPSEFRRQHPRNANLPTMPLCEEGIREALQVATRHVAYFAKMLKRQLQGSETGITNADYSLAFGLFREEFGAFRGLVRFAVRSLKDKFAVGAAVGDALVERQNEVDDVFAKLELASLCQKVQSMKRRFADTKTKIDKVHMAIWRVYK